MKLIHDLAWNKYHDSASRLNAQGLLDPQPDVIICGHGTNDAGANNQVEYSLTILIHKGSNY